MIVKTAWRQWGREAQRANSSPEDDGDGGGDGDGGDGVGDVGEFVEGGEEN